MSAHRHDFEPLPRVLWTCPRNRRPGPPGPAEETTLGGAFGTHLAVSQEHLPSIVAPTVKPRKIVGGSACISLRADMRQMTAVVWLIHPPFCRDLLLGPVNGKRRNTFRLAPSKRRQREVCDLGESCSLHESERAPPAGIPAPTLASARAWNATPRPASPLAPSPHLPSRIRPVLKWPGPRSSRYLRQYLSIPRGSRRFRNVL